MTKAHWHVATGFAGYGPDGADGYGSAPDVNGAADMARDDLRDEIDGLADVAHTYADSGDYESAWKSHVLADDLDVIRRNLDPKRAEAPLYVGRPDFWLATITTLVAETFPLSLDIDGNRRLYVWECAEPECEHVADDAHTPCRAFLMCENEATTTIDSPPIGAVPACERCAAKLERLASL